jgi:hypothetical protein
MGRIDMAQPPVANKSGNKHDAVWRNANRYTDRVHPRRADAGQGALHEAMEPGRKWFEIRTMDAAEIMRPGE